MIKNIRSLIVMVLLPILVVTPIMASDNVFEVWHGVVKINANVELNLVLNLRFNDSKVQSVTLDSPDQGAYGIEGKVNYYSPDSLNVYFSYIGFVIEGRKVNDKLVCKWRQNSMEGNLVLSPRRLFSDKHVSSNSVQLDGLLNGQSKVNRPQSPKPPYPYTKKDVFFKNQLDDITLAGTLTLPTDFNDRTPIVVMVTGSGLQNRDEEIYGHKPFEVIADYFARNSIASLRYDDRGYGQSTGDATVATTEDFARDAMAALEYVHKEEKFQNIGILGHSEGATIAFMLGSKYRSDVSSAATMGKPDFIVAIGAQAVRGDSILVDQSATLLRQSHLPESVVSDYVEALYKLYAMKISEGVSAAVDVDAICAGWDNTPVYMTLKDNMKKIASISNPWLDYYIKFSPAESISSIACPAFILYGGKDIQVRPEINMPKMQQVAPNAKIKLYPDLNHLFQHAQTGAVQEYEGIEETISPEVLQDFVDFIYSINH